MDEQTRQRLIAEESSKFLNDGFAPLDLSSSPDLQAKPSEGFGPDRHGFHNVDMGQANPLKAFAQNPDDDALARVATETGDPELADKFRDDTEGAEAEAFVASHPAYFRSDENFEAIKDYMDEHRLAFTRENLHTAFVTLSRAGRLETKPGTAKSLSEQEKLHVIALCKAGQIEDAISQFLDYSLPDASDLWENETAFLSDPDTLSVRNRACYFVWQQTRPVLESEEWHTFLKSYFRNRPVRTVNDLDQAWVQFQQHERSAFRSQLLSPDHNESPSPKQITDGLDDLNDDEIEKLTTATRRHRARASRRATGVLA